MTTPPIEEFDVMLTAASARRTIANELHRQQQRQRAIAFWRAAMIAFGVIGIVAAFALGVMVMSGL